MRALAALVLVGCAADPTPSPGAQLPTDAIWASSIHSGDAVVAVPGTGSYDSLGKWIDAANGAVLDWRTNHSINPIVLEQAIAATERAGVDPSTVTLAVWGSGSQADHFTYRSLAGDEVTFVVVGGTSKCARGGINDNLLNYTSANAETDARDLWARTAELGAPHVTIVSHSWGGAVAEHLVLHQLGDSTLGFVFAAGVPGTILGESMVGPGLRPEHGVQLYEVDRPDDPVHALDFAWDLEGHQYDIMYVGDTFQGSYGITTDELSCHEQPGACPH